MPKRNPAVELVKSQTLTEKRLLLWGQCLPFLRQCLPNCGESGQVEKDACRGESPCRKKCPFITGGVMVAQRLLVPSVRVRILSREIWQGKDMRMKQN